MFSSVHADRQETLRISARRFEASPYRDCYADAEMVCGVYAGRFYPMFNGDDPAEKYWLLRRKAALYDVPERPVEISGPDVVAFLEKVFACPVASLKEGRGRYAIACTPQGGVFMDGILFRLGETRFWYVQPDGALEAWLIALSEGFDIAVSDPGSRVLQIQGPASLAVMQAASGGAIDETMGYFRSGFFDLGGQELYVSRTGWTGELGYEVYSQGRKTDHRRLWDHLIAAGRTQGMEFASASSMEIRRIEAGILDNQTDMDRTMTPFQAGLGRFIDLEKGDFIGRKALLEAGREVLLYGITSAEAAPAMNARVLDGGRAVGRVTVGAVSPYLACGIGYVRFFEAGDWAGRQLTLEQPDGSGQACEVRPLPFYDPEKRIARGLDRKIP